MTADVDSTRWFDMFIVHDDGKRHRHGQCPGMIGMPDDDDVHRYPCRWAAAIQEKVRARYCVSQSGSED